MAFRKPSRKTIERATAHEAAGIPDAMEWLAFVYRWGRGARGDLTRALRYNLEGARLGHANCIYHAADTYDLGEEARRNYRKTWERYARACARLQAPHGA